jgi:hypothetical protein
VTTPLTSHSPMAQPSWVPPPPNLPPSLDLDELINLVDQYDGRVRS